MGAIVALFTFTVRQALRDLKFWMVAGTLFLPCLMTGIIRYFASAQSVTRIWEMYHGLIQFMLLMGMIPLACMIFGSALIGTEVESRTIAYLITRRLNRRTVLLTRFAAVFCLLTASCYAALIALHVCALAGQPWLSSMWASVEQWNLGQNLAVYLVVMPLAVAGYLAIFTFMGIIAAKPLALSLAYYVIFEILIGNIPADVSKYSIIRHLRAWVVDRIPELNQMNPQLFVAGDGGLENILMITFAALVLASLGIARRELVPHKVARD